MPGAWAFTDWQWRFPVTDETRAHGTVKQVWREAVVVHALVKATARSSEARFQWQ